MSHERLTVFDPDQPKLAYLIFERNQGSVNVVFAPEGVRPLAERWAHQGFVMITGEVPNLQSRDVLPDHEDFFRAMADELRRMKLESRLETVDS